jgi:hypothetical protein
MNKKYNYIISPYSGIINYLFLMYSPAREVSGSLRGFYMNTACIISSILFYLNKKKNNSKSFFLPDRLAIGYFHSHISGNLSLSFPDKIILFLLWMLNQNLLLVYTINSDFMSLVFYMFTFRGIKIVFEKQYSKHDLFFHISSQLKQEIS